MTSLTRVALIIDGGYFNKVSNYYKHNHPIGRRISVQGIQNFVIDSVMREEGGDSICQIVEAHYFRGRYSVGQLEERAEEKEWPDKQLRNDRNFDLILSSANITAHYAPVIWDGDEDKEVGVDVWLALQSYELASRGRCDLLAMVVCDGDYVPLVRKVGALGVRVMLVGWEFPGARVSSALVREVSYSVALHKIIDEAIAKFGSEGLPGPVDNLFVD